jgi:redox-sensitive bicupin YhaK (pirin superfamily)
MTNRTVELIVGPPEPHMVGDGFRVHNFIPSMYRLDMKRMDPFIMMDYNAKTLLEPSETPRGVDVHPHRGFETVTVAYKGKVAHHDSAGNSGVIGEGEVQWMTAASGILHKEYHEKEFSKKGGEFQMVQLWVNLPARFKMSAPKYQGITREMLRSYQLPGGMGSIEIIAGEHKGIKGAASTFSPVHLFTIEMKKGASEVFELPAHYNTALLVIEGSILINDVTEADKDHLVLMANDAERFSMKAAADAKVLLLSGEPLNEPIAAHGPFVMNTREELIQAFRDFQNGKFGELN